MSETLEAKAQEAWHEHGRNAPEYVGLGFVVSVDADGAPESIVWYELENAAEVGEFYVTSEEMTRVFEIAEDERAGSGPLYGVLLWHSHYISKEPSLADLEGFPAWLCDAGIVYHAPTQTTTLYNAAGLISNSPAEPEPLVIKPNHMSVDTAQLDRERAEQERG